MAGFIKRTKAVDTVNPAGGLNPALEPNVGQYGWTNYESGIVNQLIQYVDLCKQYSDQAKDAAAYIAGRFIEIEKFMEYVGDAYNTIKPIYDNIGILYEDIKVRHEDIKVRHADIIVKHGQVQTSESNAHIYSKDAEDAAHEASDSAIAAEESKVQAALSAKEAADLAEELRKGQVYRGTWNMQKENKFPPTPDTNSVWDVILNEGSTTGVTVGGKLWYWGDRLIYIKLSDEWVQVESGGSVTSVNGKTGAVTITREEINAAPTGYGLGTGGETLSNLSLDNVKGSGFYSVYSGTTGGPLGDGPSGSSVQHMEWGAGAGASQLFSSYTSDRWFLRRKSSSVWSNWQEIHHAGRPPTAVQVGAMPITGGTFTGAVSMNAALTLNNHYLMGANNSIILRDHANGNVTLSAGVNTSGTPGTLYLGYTAAQSANAGYNTRDIRLEAPMTWKSLHTIVDNTGNIPSTRLTGALTVPDTGIVTTTGQVQIGGRLNITNPGDAMILSKTPLSSTPNYVLARDATNTNIWSVGTNGYHILNLVNYVSGITVGIGDSKVTSTHDLFVKTNQVYHQGFKPTAVDVGALPLAGGNLSGPLTWSASTSSIQAATKDTLDIRGGRHLMISASNQISGGATYIGANFYWDGGWKKPNAATESVILEIGNDRPRLLHSKAGEAGVNTKAYHLYTEAFKPNITDLGGAKSSFIGGGANLDDYYGTTNAGLYEVDGTNTNSWPWKDVSNGTMVVTPGLWATQVAYHKYSGETYQRSRDSGTNRWNNWAKVFNEKFPMDLSSIGALPTTGGTMTGALNIRTASAQINLIETDNQDKTWRMEAQGNNLDFTEVGVATRFRLLNGGGAILSGNLQVSQLTTTSHVNMSTTGILKFPTSTYAAGAQIYARDGGQYGANFVINTGGNMILGAGESGTAFAELLGVSAREDAYILADGDAYISTNCNVIAERKVHKFSTDGSVTLNDGSTTARTFYGSSNTYVSRSGASFYIAAIADNGRVYIEGKLNPVARVNGNDYTIYHTGNPPPNPVGSSIGTSQILGGNVNMDDLKTPGVYHQTSNANAISGSNYPEALAGSLIIYAAAGIVQEYRTYSSSRLWRRAQYSTGAWTAWSSDYNSLNKDTSVLSLAGGTMTGAINAAVRKSAINVLNQASIKFYDGNNTWFHNLAMGSELVWATGSDASQTRRLVLTSGGDLGTSGGINSGGNVTTGNGSSFLSSGIFRTTRATNPMVEWHKPGVSAYIQYIDNANNLKFGTSNGSGSEAAGVLTLNPSLLFAHVAKIQTNFNTNRSWTAIGAAGVYVDCSLSAIASGNLQAAISMYTYFPNQYYGETLFGMYHGNDWAQSSQVLSAYNASSGHRMTWQFRNNGTLEPSHGVWRIPSDGNIVSNAWGGSSITSWCSRSFAPISDINLKKVVSESTHSALGEVGKMKFHSYVWDGEEFSKKTVKLNKIGVIAQEMEEIDPNYVRDIETYNEDGSVDTSIKALDTANLLAVALKAIQELEAKVAKLEEKLNVNV